MFKRTLPIILFLIGLAVGQIPRFWIGTHPDQKIPDRHLGQVGLINPLLECGSGSFAEVPGLQEQLKRYVDRYSSSTTLAVYFRDLNNGPWIGINADEEFVGGSLLKVAILMGYLSAAQIDRGLLEKKLKYASVEGIKAPLEQVVQPKSQLIEGKEYTVRDLIERMIIYSDNRTIPPLMEAGLGKAPDVVMREIGIPFRVDPKVGSIVSVQSYSGFFRVLYNASYLSKEMSQFALDLLSKADYKDGLLAGLPSHLVVAHKFGEREAPEGRQLHDCGIVYFPKRPYLICVMTRGKDLNELQKHIGEISRITYQYINAQK